MLHKRTLLLLLVIVIAHTTAVAKDVGAATVSKESSSKPLVLGIFPRRNATETYKLFTPLVQYLTRSLGREVVLSTQKDMDAFWETMSANQFDFVHYNQFHYVKSHKLFGHEVILRNEELNEAFIAPVLVTRKDSGIETLEDLRGKTIAFAGGSTAMLAYIGPRYMLRKAGLYAGDYSELVVTLPPQAVIATYFGKADAAGSGNSVLKIFSKNKRIDVGELKILATGDPIAHLAWAVTPQMSESQKLAIQSSLAQLRNTPEGKEILKTAQLTGLIPATDGDYDSCRMMIKDVLDEEY